MISKDYEGNLGLWCTDFLLLAWQEGRNAHLSLHASSSSISSRAYFFILQGLLNVQCHCWRQRKAACALHGTVYLYERCLGDKKRKKKHCHMCTIAVGCCCFLAKWTLAFKCNVRIFLSAGRARNARAILPYRSSFALTTLSARVGFFLPTSALFYCQRDWLEKNWRLRDVMLVEELKIRGV